MEEHLIQTALSRYFGSFANDECISFQQDLKALCEKDKQEKLLDFSARFYLQREWITK